MNFSELQPILAILLWTVVLAGSQEDPHDVIWYPSEESEDKFESSHGVTWRYLVPGWNAIKKSRERRHREDVVKYESSGDIMFPASVSARRRPQRQFRPFGPPPDGFSPAGLARQRRPTTATPPPTRPSRRPTTSTTPPTTTTMGPCERRCPVTPEFNPVCGTDRNSYTNPGRLKCAQMCGKSVQLVHHGNCQPGGRAEDA